MCGLGGGNCLSCRGISSTDDLADLRPVPSVRHPRFIDVEAREQRVVDDASHLVALVGVELRHVAQHVDRSEQSVGSESYLTAGVGQVLRQTQPISHNLVEPGADLGLGQCAVGRQVDEALLLGIERGQLALQCFVELPNTGLFLAQVLAATLGGDDRVAVAADVAA